MTVESEAHIPSREHRTLINGVLAPPLILIVLLLTSDRTVMGHAVNSRTVGFLGWLTFAVMVCAALGLFVAS